MLQVPQPSPSTLVILTPFDRHRRTVDLVPRPDALLQRGDECEHLERRPRRQSGLSEVETVGVRATVVGLARRRSSGRRTPPPTACRHPGRRASLVTASSAAFWALRVDGRGDLQPLGVQRLLVDVEQVQQFLGDLTFDEPVGSRRLVLQASLIRRHGRREDLRCTVGRRQRPDGHHAVEHPVPPLGGRLRGRRPGPVSTAAGSARRAAPPRRR